MVEIIGQNFVLKVDSKNPNKYQKKLFKMS